MDESTPARRRRYWVDPQLQAGFIARLFIVALLATVLAWTVFYWVWAPTLQSIDWGPTNQLPDQILRRATLRVLATTVVLVPAFFVLASVVGLVYSHRVAGPAHRLNRVLTALAEGEFIETGDLRRKDCLQDLSASVNVILTHLKRHRDEQRASIEAMRRELAEMESTAKAELSESETVRRHVTRLTQMADGLFARCGPGFLAPASSADSANVQPGAQPSGPS